MITTLGVRFGELNIEILLDKEDQVYFLELGPRAGGNMIPLQLSDAFGVDLVQANVLAAMGENVEMHLQNTSGCYMTYVLHSYADGTLDEFFIADEIEPCIYRKVLYKRHGEQVEAFDGAGKALGIIFLYFDSETQMNDAIMRIDELIQVRLIP